MSLQSKKKRAGQGVEGTFVSEGRSEQLGGEIKKARWIASTGPCVSCLLPLSPCGRVAGRDLMGATDRVEGDGGRGVYLVKTMFRVATFAPASRR